MKLSKHHTQEEVVKGALLRLIERKQLKNRLILAKNEQYYWTNGSTKHDMGYKPEWEAEFPWLIPEKNSIARRSYRDTLSKVCNTKKVKVLNRKQCR